MLKIGAQNITGLYIGETKIEKAYVGEDLVFSTAKKPSRLPEGYTEVEYIQNSDYKSYISPGKSVDYDIDFTFVFSAPQPHASRDQAYIHYDNFFIRLMYSDKRLEWAVNKSGTWTYQAIYQNVAAGEKIAVKYSYDADTKVGTVDVNGVKTVVNKRPSLATPSLPSKIASQYYSPIARFYYFKGVYKRNPDSATYNFELIPCINPSRVVGFYDLKNNAFIPPAAGTFIAGPAV